MFKALEDIIKDIKGNVLTIGVDNKIIDYLYKNDNINLYSISKDSNKKLFKKNKKMLFNREKSINIRKLRKKLNKKSCSYIICNMNEMFEYYKYVIKDTIYLNDKKIYVYFDENIDKDFIIDKYNRYNVNIKVTEYKTGYLLEIDNTKGKNNYIKDKLYFIKDTFYNIAETIGKIMVS